MLFFIIGFIIGRHYRFIINNVITQFKKYRLTIDETITQFKKLLFVLVVIVANIIFTFLPKESKVITFLEGVAVRIHHTNTIGIKIGAIPRINGTMNVRFSHFLKTPF